MRKPIGIFITLMYDFISRPLIRTTKENVSINVVIETIMLSKPMQNSNEKTAKDSLTLVFQSLIFEKFE